MIANRQRGAQFGGHEIDLPANEERIGETLILQRPGSRRYGQTVSPPRAVYNSHRPARIRLALPLTLISAHG
jgi:hypothetical protein